MSLNSPTFNPQQLVEEIVGRSYLMPTEIEVYVKNLIRIVNEQRQEIEQLKLAIGEAVVGGNATI